MSAPIRNYQVVLRTVEGVILKFEITFQMYEEAFGKAVEAAVSFAQDDKHEVKEIVSVKEVILGVIEC